MSISLPTPLDMMHLPALQQADMQVFLSNNQNINWQSWVKPRGVSMCFILVIAGGGGGGGGHSRAANNNGGGGGGGGSSGIARCLIPAYFLPGEIYIMVGLGGRGALPAGTTEGGSDSIVSLGRSGSSPDVIVRTAGGVAGGLGLAGSVGTGGSAGGANVARSPGNLGFSSFSSGQAGANGGAVAGGVGTSVTAVWDTVYISGGAGGAGCGTTGPGTNFAGGGITLQGTPDFGPTSLVGGTAGGGSGGGGIQLWEPFAMTGGVGGGSNNSGAAGLGGKGGIGCGGGGGGCGVTGGRGGDGGNGMVLIISW